MGPLTAATNSTGSSTLSSIPGWAVVLATALVILLSGLVVIVGRYWLEKRPTKNGAGQSRQTASTDADGSGGSLIRSWLAISLVAGLLLFCAVAFSIDDMSLRSTLFGGLIAAVGAAVAFYFSSQGADKARQDILNAMGMSTVPNLIGLDVANAQRTIAATTFQLGLSNPNALPTDVVAKQDLASGASVRNGSKITVDTSPPSAAASPTPPAPTDKEPTPPQTPAPTGGATPPPAPAPTGGATPPPAPAPTGGATPPPTTTAPPQTGDRI